MIMKKETLVFLTSLAIIFIIGYVNLTMSPKNVFDEEDYTQFQEEQKSDKEISDENQAIIEKKDTEIADKDKADDLDTDKADIGKKEDADSEKNYEILGDITDITDIKSVEASAEPSEESKEETNSDPLNISFENFKINKEKGNLEVIDSLEEKISNNVISDKTKEQFEALLLNKNKFIESEKNIELMLQTKGYNDTVAVVDENVVKVITNDTIEQADATKILDIIVSETDYVPEQIKIVKFDNINL